MSSNDNKINELVSDKKVAITGLSRLDRGILTFFAAIGIACAIGAYVLTAADAKVACLFFAAGALILTVGYYRYVKTKSEPKITKVEMDLKLKEIIDKDNEKEE